MKDKMPELDWLGLVYALTFWGIGVVSILDKEYSIDKYDFYIDGVKSVIFGIVSIILSTISLYLFNKSIRSFLFNIQYNNIFKLNMIYYLSFNFCIFCIISLLPINYYFQILSKSMFFINLGVLISYTLSFNYELKMDVKHKYNIPI